MARLSPLDLAINLASRIPFVSRLKEEIRWRSYAERVLRDLDLFVAQSRGSKRMLIESAWISARDTLPRLGDLAVWIHPKAREEKSPDAYCASTEGRANADRLKLLFEHYGSDKSLNNYHHIYGEVFARLSRVRHLLEIGIGSPNPALLSNMTEAGRPGASLRAFRDFLPEATVRGADIDPAVLFAEERIITHVVDQRQPGSFSELHALGRALPFDLVIDDGLHAPDANLTVLNFALPQARIVVVEDIKRPALPVWHTVRALLDPLAQTDLIDAGNAHVLVVTGRTAVSP